MVFNGFEQADFDLFLIDGLEERMTALKQQLRPKFEALGEQLSKELAVITGEEMYPHVAKHARRKTNPPNDSWVAVAANQRGYKMMPHFQICVWHTHVLVQWGIIYEAKNKGIFADNLVKNIDGIKKNIPTHYNWYKNHMHPEGKSEMSDQDFLDFAYRLKHKKNGEVMVGLSIPSEEAIALSPEAFRELVVETWQKLHYLHKLAR